MARVVAFDCNRISARNAILISFDCCCYEAVHMGKIGAIKLFRTNPGHVSSRLKKHYEPLRQMNAKTLNEKCGLEVAKIELCGSMPYPVKPFESSPQNIHHRQFVTQCVSCPDAFAQVVNKMSFRNIVFGF